MGGVAWEVGEPDTLGIVLVQSPDEGQASQATFHSDKPITCHCASRISVHRKQMSRHIYLSAIIPFGNMMGSHLPPTMTEDRYGSYSDRVTCVWEVQVQAVF